MAWWIAATLLGWLLPFAVRAVTVLLAPGSSTLSIMLGFFLVGVLIALPQWVMLRQRVHRASWWVLAYGLGWSIIGLLNYFTTDPFPVLVAVAVIPTIGTGIACWLLLDGSPKSQIGATSLPVA